MMKKIEIIQTADIHGTIRDYAYIAAYVNRLREQNASVLLVDCGDIFRGNILAEYSGGTIVAEIMNRIGYDFMVYGNDEHFKGRDDALAMRDRLNFPVLGALTHEADGSYRFPPCGITELAGMKIGVIGLEHSEMRMHTSGSTDPYAETAHWCRELRTQGCDIVMVISHMGIDPTYKTPTPELARQVPDLDLIADGHSHHPLPEGIRVGKTLVTQPADHMGSFVHITVTVDQGEVNSVCKLIDVGRCKTQLRPDAEVQSILDRELERIQAATVIVGHTPYLLDGGRPQIRTRETNLGDIVCDAFRAKTGAEVAIYGGGAIRASLEAGDISIFDLKSVFANGGELAVARCTGAWIRARMERSLSAYPEQFTGFCQVSGLHLLFDLDAASGSRICAITLDSGEALEDTKEYLVAGQSAEDPMMPQDLSQPQAPGAGRMPPMDHALARGQEAAGCTFLKNIGHSMDIFTEYLQSPACKLYEASAGRIREIKNR